jgi:hypothetical protein
MGDNKVGGDGGEVDGDSGGDDSVDGDGSGGTSPSRQGAGTETSVPRNWSSTAAELQDSFSRITDRSRDFRLEALYRRRGGVSSGPRPPHHRAARARGACHPMVRVPSGPPLAPVRSLSFLRVK